jgi:hypothetical protein
MEGSIVAGSFDKGVGAGSGRITGRANQIVANGTGEEFEEAVPNGDGVRLSLESTVDLSDTRIDGNGDSGVVALDKSRVTLRGGSVSGNDGYGVVAATGSRVRAERVVIDGNAAGDVDTASGGKADVSGSR